MMALIGVSIGLIGYSMYTMIDVLAAMRYKAIQAALGLKDKSSFAAVLSAILLASLLTAVLATAASFPVVAVAPQASGSGIPEVMAYLNGCLIRKVRATSHCCIRPLAYRDKR